MRTARPKPPRFDLPHSNACVQVMIERRCPGCKRTNRGSVTGLPGDPMPDGLRGAWLCDECGKSLGFVEHIRGRVRATCRCRNEVRVTAEEAIQLAHIAGAVTPAP